MPPPGPDFLEHALAMGDSSEVRGQGSKRRFVVGPILRELYARALYADSFQLPIHYQVGRDPKLMDFVPGHIFGARDSDHLGPVSRTSVMVVGKHPGYEEVIQKRNFYGASGQLLTAAFQQAGIKGFSQFYVTNVMKFAHPEPSKKSGVLKAPWLKDCLPLLHQELRLVRPTYILCLGNEAAKIFLGRSATISSMEGRVEEFEIPLDRKPQKSPKIHKAMLMVVPHPAAVLHRPEMAEQFERNIERFGQLLAGARFYESETDIDHRSVDNENDLAQILIQAEKECPDKLVAVDAEWHGKHPQMTLRLGKKGTRHPYLRTVQFSWAHKKAVCVRLRHPGGEPAFREGPKRAMKLLGKFFQDKRVAGHFFVADLEWLVAEGLDLRAQFRAPPDGPEIFGWERTATEGGFDTALAAHAINETSSLGLEALAVRYTEAPRYDVQLDKWKKDYCRDHKLSAKSLVGYGECPSEVLEPYGAYDADVTRRLAVFLNQKLDSDEYGHCCREAFWISMRAVDAVYEINTAGLYVDRDRFDQMTLSFLQARADLEQKIRDWSRWPDFNLNSVDETKEFLFGVRYNGKRSPKGKHVRLRPAGARSLKLEPLLDTSKPPVPWAKVVERGEDQFRSPSTDKKVLEILTYSTGPEAKVVEWLRDYRYIGQVLKNFLRPPKTNRKNQMVLTRAGHFIYDKGVASEICDDHRIRTHIYQTAETGRWRSARPNCQNWSKIREKDYRRILGDRYVAPLRSVLSAAPGCVLLEADYIGAELFGMAMMSGDKRMINHCQRNQLPEDHSNYYDVHSNVAKMAFQLKCEPTKKGLQATGKAYLRDLAKKVVFGIAYGRGAAAIAMEARQEGVNVSEKEAEQTINAVFKLYPGLRTFFNACQDRVDNERWLCGAFGRFRRFPLTLRDEQQKAEFQRQAMNFPIQGMIADAVSRAVDHLYHYRSSGECPEVGPHSYRIVLQIHDAILLEVDPAALDAVYDRVIPRCMTELVPVVPCNLDGIALPVGAYYLGVDKNVYLRWGIKPTVKECVALGIDAGRYAMKGG